MEKRLALGLAGDRCHWEQAVGENLPLAGPVAQDTGTHLHVSALPEQGPRPGVQRSTAYWWNGGQRRQGAAKQLLKARNIFMELTFLSVIFQV